MLIQDKLKELRSQGEVLNIKTTSINGVKEIEIMILKDNKKYCYYLKAVNERLVRFDNVANEEEIDRFKRALKLILGDKK